MQISPLSGWLLSALSFLIGGEWFKPATDGNSNHKRKNAAPKLTSVQAHIKPPPTRNPQAKIMYIPGVMNL